jgi:quercetin 2,3-dioxygenase
VLEVRRAQDRFLTRGPGVQSWHCFSFGQHYDPAHTGHGRLVVHDEHLLEPGAGFGPHPHRDLEVVSWVLEGTLLHEDAGGRSAVPAGVLQRMVTGSGVVHDERAGAAPTRFVQLWLTAEPGRPPSYEQVVVGPLAQVAPDVFAGELRGRWAVPDAERVHVHVAAGSCRVDGVALGPGDSARLTAAGPLLLEAGEPAQVLVVSLPQA